MAEIILVRPCSIVRHLWLRHPLSRRALSVWPGLDRRALGRCHGDPARITRLVARRTTMPPEAIRTLLVGLDDLDRELLFG